MMYDLRHVNLGHADILTFQYKKDALRAAKERGYYQADVMPAYNRFWRFWMLAQWADGFKTLRVAQNTPGQSILIKVGDKEI